MYCKLHALVEPGLIPSSGKNFEWQHKKKKKKKISLPSQYQLNLEEWKSQLWTTVKMTALRLHSPFQCYLQVEVKHGFYKQWRKKAMMDFGARDIHKNEG